MFRSEKGQALPIALVILGLGTLMLAPFLGHVSSSLVSSRIYGKAAEEQYAAGAGVEQAIWRLTNDGLAEQLAEVGDSTSYQLSPINGTTPDITITAQLTGGEGKAGLIADEVIDTLEFDVSSCWAPFILPISSDIFAVAYWGSGFNGHLKTIQVAPDGQITDSIIDAMTFETWSGWTPFVIHISGEIYAIAYMGPWLSGYLKTIQIAPDGQIINTDIDTIEFETLIGWRPHITHVSGDIFAVAYWGFFNDGLIKTIQIASDGQINDSTIDTLEFDNFSGLKPSFLHITGDLFAIVYRGQGNDGLIKTIQIAPDGQISDSVIDTFEFDTSKAYEPSVSKVSNSIVVIAYRGNANDGFVKTVQIAANGQISDSAIDTFEFDESNAYEPAIVHVSNDIYAIAYRGTDNDGFTKTIQIAPDGQIADAVIDALEFDGSNGREPRITAVSNEVYAIAYRGRGNDGFLKTIQIAPGGTSNLYEIVSTAGDITIRATVAITDETTSIITWVVE